MQLLVFSLRLASLLLPGVNPASWMRFSQVSLSQVVGQLPVPSQTPSLPSPQTPSLPATPSNEALLFIRTNSPFPFSRYMEPLPLGEEEETTPLEPCFTRGDA